jgi:hypothetical protein
LKIVGDKELKWKQEVATFKASMCDSRNFSAKKSVTSNTHYKLTSQSKAREFLLAKRFTSVKPRIHFPPLCHFARLDAGAKA